MTTQNLRSSGVFPNHVTTWAQKWMNEKKIQPDSIQWEHLAGDGSTRQFFRLRSKKNLQSWVLLFDPDSTGIHRYSAHQSFLLSRKIQVPQFFEADEKSGVLLMQDLGDELLQNTLLSHPTQRMSWLKKTTEFLAHWHLQVTPTPSSVPGSQLFFNAEKFQQELSFTVEHLHALLKIAEPVDLNAIQAFCQSLEKIEPKILCHRDYHTRNLLIHAGELYAVDFQDARMGPPHYDLGSFLYDAYMPLSLSERQTLKELYLSLLKKNPAFKNLSSETFENDFCCIAFQRVIKAMGSFASFFTRYGKKTHLGYLAPAWEMAASLAKQNPSLKDLFPLSLWKSRMNGQGLWQKSNEE